MILYASQRGRSTELAVHLLNGDENDHVTVHEIRGFVSDDLAEALREAYAMSRGTRCKQFLFSLSLNPPEYADVPIEDFEAALEEIEKRLSLVGQPRIIVFHEKNGRRHCHAVWSRIDTDKLVAVRMSHFKRKLMEVSRFLYLKHGWKMPDGMKKGQPRSPWHLTREEYRQAVRLSEDPQALKAMFKAAWEQSDSKATFIRALEEHGFLLARGDRRSFVAIDVKGGIYSLTRWIDIGTRDLKSRIGAPESLPDIRQAKAFLTSSMTENLNSFIDDARKQDKEVRLPLVQEIRSLVLSQRQERQSLIETQQKRWVQETRQRAARLHSGVAGIWQRVTGEYQKVRLLNETEAKAGLERDRRKLHALIRSHLLERQELQKTVLFYKEEHKVEVLRLRQEIARYVSTATEPPLPFAGVAAVEKVPLAAQLAEVATKIALLSGDLSLLQSALENNLLSDDLRSRIRFLIEKTMATLQLKDLEIRAREQKAEEKTQEYLQKLDAFNELIRKQAELQIRQEEEQRRIAANREFYAIISNMGYSLNGIPRFKITLFVPEQLHLDERAYARSLRQQDNAQLLGAVFRSPSPSRPELAVPQLRQSVLQAQELISRTHLPPTDRSHRTAAPPAEKQTAASIRFNNTRREV